MSEPANTDTASAPAPVSEKKEKKKCRACSKNGDILKDMLSQIHDEVTHAYIHAYQYHHVVSCVQWDEYQRR